jgi:hypothetical protein
MSASSQDLDLVGSSNQGLAIGRTVGQIFLYVFQAAIRPVVLLTRAIFRKDLGERYFTAAHAFIGVLLLAAVSLVTASAGPWRPLGSLVMDGTSGVSSSSGAWSGGPARTGGAAWSNTTLIIGGLWALALIAAAAHHGLQVRRRYKVGRRWHSYCPGVPRAAWYGPFMEGLLAVLAAAAFAWFGQYGFAGLAAVSAVLARASDHAAQREFYRRMLDAIDAQIEGQNLQKAIRAYAGPAQTEGFAVAFPARARGVFGQLLAEAQTSSPKTVALVEPKPSPSPVSASSHGSSSAG